MTSDKRWIRSGGGTAGPWLAAVRERLFERLGEALFRLYLQEANPFGAQSVVEE